LPLSPLPLSLNVVRFWRSFFVQVISLYDLLPIIPASSPTPSLALPPSHFSTTFFLPPGPLIDRGLFRFFRHTKNYVGLLGPRAVSLFSPSLRVLGPLLLACRLRQPLFSHSNSGYFGPSSLLWVARVGLSFGGGPVLVSSCPSLVIVSFFHTLPGQRVGRGFVTPFPVADPLISSRCFPILLFSSRLLFSYILFVSSLFYLISLRILWICYLLAHFLVLVPSFFCLFLLARLPTR